MKFSIIVPIYNISSYIDQCLESIVNQNYEKLEIILINDGSTDCSLEKIKTWEAKDKRIIVINKPNGGLSSARNEGLKHATGEYILFVDGDDWLDKTALHCAKEFIDQYGDVDMLCFDYWAYYTKEKMKLFSYNAQQVLMDGKSFFEHSKFLVTAWSKFYNKTFLDKIGLLFLEGRLHEDMSYTIPLCVCANKVGWINKSLYYYRQNREGSIMKHISYRNVLDFSHAICFDYYFLKERKLLTPYVNNWVIGEFYRSCFSGFVSLKTLVKAMQENKVLDIACDMGEQKYFWIKLAYNHEYMKLKTKLGMLKRKILNTT